MFKRYPHLFLALALLIFWGAGSLQGQRITGLREAEAFYRWLISAATNERMFTEKAGSEYDDATLFAKAVAAAEDYFPGVSDGDVKKLVALAADTENEAQLFDFARDESTAPLRREFLELARRGRLEYARGIQYADAQAGGVGIFNILLGFRRVAATFLWIEIDSFWHQGQMHRMIPLMKTCVTLDPNFVDAYLLGAWHLAYNVTAKMPDTPPALKVWNRRYEVCLGEKELFYYIAIDFLKDGILNNPRNYKLYFDLGFGIYHEKLKDYPNAVKYLREAVRQPHERWVPRMLYRALENNRQYAEALAGWEDYARRFPESMSATDTAPRFIQRNRALLLEQQAEAEREQAAAAAPAEKERLLADAAAKYAQAREIWKNMAEPYANARLLRMEAMELADQGRYYEAVAKLNQARWDNPSDAVFTELSDLIIEFNQRGNIPLSVSEQKAVLRRVAGDDCEGKPAR
jgi:hypothetical protein